MTTPPGQEPRSGPTRGGPARPAPRGAGSGWAGGNANGRRGGPGRGAGGPARDGADPRRDGYGGAAGTGGGIPGTGREESGAWREGRGGFGPAGRGRDGQRGADPGSRGPVPPRRGQSGARDDFAAGQRDARRGPDVPGDAPPGLRAGPALRWLGALSTRVAVYILLGATLLGVIGTLLTGSEPGGLLGFLIIIGSVVAALGVARRGLYLLFPLPALAFFLGAVLTGAIHDRGVDTSTTALGVSFLQWIANVFFAMCTATILVLLIGGARWLFSMQLVSGQFPMSADRAGASRTRRSRPAPGSRPGGGRHGGGNRDQWGTADPRNDRDDLGGSRANRDQRDNRAPWGNPGLPPNRDPRGNRDQRDGSGPWIAGNRRDSRDQRGNPDPWDPRDPRDDRPRPTF